MTQDATQSPSFNRRNLLKQGAAAGAAGLAFSALSARAHDFGGYGKHRPYSTDYGPLEPKEDMVTGLKLLALPKGFEYMSFGWTGQIMDDGRPTPTDHDGMAVCGQYGRFIALVRNHELSAGESTQCFVPGGMYNNNEYGGTTNLVFDTARGRFVKHYTSLGGTIRNCAGGLTPWNSWISCEETFHEWNNRADGFNHGYLFDVPAWGVSTGQPIRAAGRFSHEAVAVDPKTGVVYQTEDAGSSAFYKYVQPGAHDGHWGGWGRKDWGGHDRFWGPWRQRGPLRDGGELYAMVVEGESRKDLTLGYQPGDTFKVTWQKVGDPEGKEGRAFDSAPDAAVFSRGEGCWEDDGLIYFVSTDGGAAGLGQVWVYNPRKETVSLVYESANPEDVDGPDNIAISPRGGIILCEDGDSNPKRLIGLTTKGDIFPFAENLIDLKDGDLAKINAYFPGVADNFWDAPVRNFSSQEWCGATFHDDWLFANVQSPGVTFAIRGPWRKGAL
ncbi:alkaline phosphatase PhoX [Hyphococcus sp.]|uniref:alkaline phosphatase PhoX n=1 Tax=Hyphococcus sp. TaxID=2038636 RepID=UPI003D11D6A4